MTALQTTPTDGRPVGISCEKYVRGEGKRCSHYLQNGACSLPGEHTCVKWLKKNGHRQPPVRPANEQPRDLFGNPLLAPPAKKKAKTRPANPGKPPVVIEHSPAVEETKPPIRALTTEDIESFKVLNVEVCVRSEDLGDIWFVANYTGQPQKEMYRNLIFRARRSRNGPTSRIPPRLPGKP